MIRIPILALLVVTLFGCDSERETVYSVPPELENYITSFEMEASIRGIELNINDLVVEYMSDLELDGVEAAGLCFSETSDDAPTIHLDTLSSNWTSSEHTREALIFHELGHCVLDRGHTSALLPNCNFKSIMKPSGDPSYSSFTLYKRAYYLDELFNINAAPPTWALQGSQPYDGITDANKIPIFHEEFDNNAAGWNLDDGDFEGSIQNGTYTMATSSTESAFSSMVNLSFNPDLFDFEIETSIKLVNGTDFVNGILWGGNPGGEVDFLQYSLNIGGDGLIGTFLNNEYVSNPYDTFLDGQFNKLTIRKIGDNYYFYCNEKLMDTVPYESYDSKSYGLYVTTESKMEIDYFRVSSLN